MVQPLVRKSAILDAAGRAIFVDVRTPRAERLSELERSVGLEAAAWDRHNEKHWAGADGRPLSALLSQHLPVVRDRLRYECANSGDAKGMVDVLAHAVVGIGPTLSVNSDDPDTDTAVEEEFAAFAEDCDFEQPDVSLGDILFQQMREQAIAGEDFCSLVNDETYPGPVQLRLLTVAPERISTPYDRMGSPSVRDGLEFDARGRKVGYWVSQVHPRETALFALGKFCRWDYAPAADMLHSYLRVEAGQHRGYPWFAPGLDENAGLRRFAAATVSSAETAADISFVLQTNAALAMFADPSKWQTWPAMDAVPTERNMGLVMPPGYEAKQFEGRHPNAQYRDFVKERRAAMARPLGMPYSVATGDFADDSFAGGRLGQLQFQLLVLVLRQWKARRLLRRVFARWLAEARLSLPRLSALATWPAERVARLVRSADWSFRQLRMGVNPVQEQQAITEGLGNESTTLIDVCAEEGLDWEAQLAKGQKVRLRKLKLAAEAKAEAARLGLSEAEAAAALAGPKGGPVLKGEAAVDAAEKGGGMDPKTQAGKEANGNGTGKRDTAVAA